MSKKGHLSIVPFNPTEYVGSDVVALKNSSVIQSQPAINSAFSLYFHWPDHRTCFCSLPNQESTPCVLDYDRDEARPSEIKVKVTGHTKTKNIFSGASLRVIFEIFGTAYEFISPILACNESEEEQDWDYILDLPPSITVIRARRVPRFRIDDDSQRKVPEFIWTERGDGEPIPLLVTEIGLNSIRAKANAKVGKNGSVRVRDLKIRCEIVRNVGDEIVFDLKFDNPKCFGQFFDIYREIALPELRDRYEFPFQDGLDLYLRSNYFNKFSAEKDHEALKSQLDQVAKTWDTSRDSRHLTVLDHYIVNGAGSPTGCSGLALQNFAGSQSIWTFHQLCAIKDPNLIEESGLLYTWRAVYLAARPEHLSATGCFVSKSRWLERIYVKHAMNSHETKLIAISNRKCEFSSTGSAPAVEFRAYEIGQNKRISTLSSDLWGCAGPTYLNANGHLDAIVALSENITADEIYGLGCAMAKNLGLESISLQVTAPAEAKIESLGGTIQPADRLFLIPKSELLGFVSSVEHSVAVTERKILRGVAS